MEKIAIPKANILTNDFLSILKENTIVESPYKYKNFAIYLLLDSKSDKLLFHKINF